MAQDSWPSPNHNSRNVTDAEYERIAERFSDNGVYGTPLDAPVVTAGAGLSVDIRAEVYASVRGHAWYSGASTVNLTISDNTSGQTRTDRVVLRLDRSTWDVRAVIKEGSPGSGPPVLTTGEGFTTYEVLLANVTVPDGASTVTVTRGERYVGKRLRPTRSTSLINPNPEVGDFLYETDTGRVRLYDGSQLRTLYEDTGLLFISPGFSTWNQVFNNVGRRVGDQVWLRVWVERVGSTFSVNDPDGSKIGVLPAALRSTYNNFFPARFTSSGGNARVEVRNNGEIWVTHNENNVTVGRHLALTMSYLRI